MLILGCPSCGVMADETELAPGGQAHITPRGPGSRRRDPGKPIFSNGKNPKGVHFERWRHSHGCGKWFHAAAAR